MSKILTDKTYNYIKHGLDMLCQNDPAVRLVFSDWELIFDYIRKHYKTINTSQVVKNKLDTLTQDECNYWFWKAELDELLIKACKTEKQKVNILRKNISLKMKDLALTLSCKISKADYKD
jgi:hypothetical protein